jgi:chromosome segregation protein
MKLISLELSGFKSFLHRTAFRFDDGITCIVGPNGCGKSNIVDAVTWVLGERGTKSLRVKEMGDVIFHGSSAKKQVNVAEVTIGLMNEEREYSVKRRIYRDGTNEYFINGDLVRLKDVQDFFLGTGIGLHSYAIIEQGNIEYFTQMRPHERRIAIEETSGITRFEEKKRDAFARMEEVRSNLDRVDDLLREVKSSYGKAEEESARLLAYNGLKERLKAFDIAFLTDSFGRLAKKAAKLEERETTLASELAAKLDHRQGIREKIRSKDEEIGLIDSVGRQVELDIRGKEKDMEARLLEINHLEEETKRLHKTAADLKKEIEVIDEKVRLDTEEVQGLSASAEKEREALKKIEEEGASLEIEREARRLDREKLEEAVEEQRNRLFAAMTMLTEINNRIAEKERMAKEKEARRERRLEEERQLAERLRLLEEKAASLKLAADREASEKARLEKEEKGFGERAEGLAREIGKAKSAMEGLKGLKKGKEEIFKQMKSYGDSGKKAPSPYGQLINILRPSRETEQVMEKFFSREMEYHVLKERDPLSLSIISKEYGNDFVFFPKKGMFTLTGEEADVRLTRVENLPEAFRRIDAGEEGLFLAGNVLVDSRGFIRKGRDRSALSISEFREKMRLESEIAEIEDQLKARSAALDALLASQRSLEKMRPEARDKVRSQTDAASRVERDIIENEAQMRTTRERLAESASGPGQGIEDDDTSVSAEEKEEKERAEAERQGIERILIDMRSALEDAKESQRRVDASFHDISIGIERGRSELRKNEEEAVRKRSAVEALQEERTVKERRIAEVAGDLQNASARAAALEEGMSAMKEDCEKTVTRYEEMKERLGNAHSEKAALEEEFQAVGEECERARAKREGAEKERIVVQEKKDAVRQRLLEDYGVEEPAQEPAQVVKDEAERERILQEIAAIGDVNFRAEKEAAALRERIEFLEQQKGDLSSAMESLKKTIAKIDSISRDLFLETFERVNEAFKGFTYTLFKGGQGMLSLNSETNGVDLYVQPPGKKVIRMELFSGGEKALVSLAFLFSLMNTKPSPFTLMDEIDAPLDDSNLLSLLDIVRTISRKTQAILITHNRLTMESSNTIYGVTMEDDGVSKTISIKL